jgi:putative flavoprotein involved in K+ transport
VPNVLAMTTTTRTSHPQIRHGRPERIDTVVIGAGQSGLAAGYHLARRGQSFVILDAYARVGDRWRNHYDSLRLYTPAKYDGLPGMAFPGDRYSWPTGAQMGDFLQSYAERFDLPVRGNTAVDHVGASGDGYLVDAGESQFEAASIVIATGAQQLPKVPEFAAQLDGGIRQLHSSEYRNPQQLQPGGVLVVGASHSGADIALELCAQHHTWLSGPVRGQIPFDIEGRPARQIMRVLWFAANHVLTEKTPMGRKMREHVRSEGGPLLRVKLPHLAAAGVERAESKTVGVRDGLPLLEDGTLLDVANVIWCTGFRRDDSWIDLPIFDEDGWPLQHRGVVAAAPGIYFLGLKFQYAFASMLIGGVGRDAAHVAKHIAARPSRVRV